MTLTILTAPGGPTSEITNQTTFAHWQYELILYALVVAFFALFASGVYSISTRSEISKQYRSASVTSALITWVAALAYLALIGIWLVKYSSNGAGSAYTPDPGTIFTGLRFADWSVTVPLLTVELFAVCSLAGQRALTTRAASIVCAFLMILTGFFGAIAVGQNNPSNIELIVWGLISTVFFIALYPLMLGPVVKTMKEVTKPTGISLRNAAILLLSVWGTYPLVYLIWLWADANDSGWATTVQLAFTAADIIAKAGYGVLLHKVAKLRTAEDADHPDSHVPDTFPAAVSINGELLSLPGHPMSANGHARHLVGASTGPTSAISGNTASRIDESAGAHDPRPTLDRDRDEPTPRPDDLR